MSNAECLTNNITIFIIALSISGGNWQRLEWFGGEDSRVKFSLSSKLARGHSGTVTTHARTSRYFADSTRMRDRQVGAGMLAALMAGTLTHPRGCHHALRPGVCDCTRCLLVWFTDKCHGSTRASVRPSLCEGISRLLSTASNREHLRLKSSYKMMMYVRTYLDRVIITAYAQLRSMLLIALFAFWCISRLV